METDRNSVAARNYAGTNECHGWVGVRFEHEAGGSPSDIILHINMRDDSNLAQQAAVGILGVNLIHAAFHAGASLQALLDDVYEQLSIDRLEIDLVELSGPAFGEQDHCDTGLALVRNHMARAVLFKPDGMLAPPTEVLRKRPIVVSRILGRDSTPQDRQRLVAGSRMLPEEVSDLERDILAVLEVNLDTGDESDQNAPRERLADLLEQGEWALLSGLPEAYQLTSYMRRYSHAPLRFVLGVSTLVYVMHHRHYGDVPGGALEAIGKLFATNVRIYASEMPRAEVESHLATLGVDPDFLTLESQEMVSAAQLKLKPPFDLLYQYLLDIGWILPLEMPAEQ